jgi:hypothetical protein
MITKACYQRGSGVLGQCSSLINRRCIRTGNGFDSPRRIASHNRRSLVATGQERLNNSI